MAIYTVNLIFKHLLKIYIYIYKQKKFHQTKKGKIFNNLKCYRRSHGSPSPPPRGAPECMGPKKEHVKVVTLDNISRVMRGLLPSCTKKKMKLLVPRGTLVLVLCS